MSVQPNNNQPQQPPQPNTQTILNTQKTEIDRLSDNRIYLIALLEDTKIEARAEIEKQRDEVGRLMGVVSQLKGMLTGDMLEEADSIISGSSQNP